jgi:hypothetical protein
MAWPRCPRCQVPDVKWRRRANESTPAESFVFRSYRCPCGWSAWTVETVFAVDTPTDFLERRFGDLDAAPTQPTLSTDD